ncbi:MinD/ParA family protein [Cellulosimicrobium cellulans]|uniref:MinD/ParA family ATP-binding protein n=1 Tax=Cellulosimicrobium cellulans TaxID=1710 RepID=UPI0003095C94|nr:hypothetical protein [Cellulosimicrobium cellulans]
MITVLVRPDGTGGQVRMPDRVVDLNPGPPSEVQAQAVSVLIEHSASSGESLTVQAETGAETRHLRVTPDGRVEVITLDEDAGLATSAGAPDGEPTTAAVPEPADEEPAALPAFATAPHQEPRTEEPTPPPSSDTPRAAPAMHVEAPATRRERRESFLTQEQVEEPAQEGLRGMLTRVGIRMAPNEAERAQREDARHVSQHWPGPRTVVIVNGKGGANKTPTTICLSAVFALFGGAGVAAMDNNQTRGTLGWRTEQGPHEATFLDLLPAVDRLLGTSAQSADLAHYVHHQTRDRYDVLRSQPLILAKDQRLGADQFDALHSVLRKYYRLIFIDTGNDESDELWLRAVENADQLVVATTTQADRAEAGRLLLDTLEERDERSAALARNAVVVVSQEKKGGTLDEASKLAADDRWIAREAVAIPFDPAMQEGTLRYGALRPETRRAWLSAGAAVARGL